MPRSAPRSRCWARSARNRGSSPLRQGSPHGRGRRAAAPAAPPRQPAPEPTRRDLDGPLQVAHRIRQRCGIHARPPSCQKWSELRAGARLFRQQGPALDKQRVHIDVGDPLAERARAEVAREHRPHQRTQPHPITVGDEVKRRAHQPTADRPASGDEFGQLARQGSVPAGTTDRDTAPVAPAPASRPGVRARLAPGARAGQAAAGARAAHD